MRMIAAIFAEDVRHLFRNVIAAIVVLGLTLVPPLYAWFTTLGFWDPYDSTGNIKVAVASVDEGYRSDLLPTPINAGESVLSALRANDRFDWQFVSEQEAIDGVRSGEYYAALVIPKNFSADLMTVFTGQVTEAKIDYWDNEKENAIAQRVTSTGASTLQETIDETFADTVAKVALGTTASLTNFMDGEGILTYAQTLSQRLEAATGELAAAADQTEAYADLLGATGSLTTAAGTVLDEAGKAPEAVRPLIGEGDEALTGARDALTAAADGAEGDLATARESYDAVAAAVEEAFATMEEDPAAAAAVLSNTWADVEALASAYGELKDALATADPDNPAVPLLGRAQEALGALAESLQQAEGALGRDKGALEEAHRKVAEGVGQARDSLTAAEDTYRDQLKGELERLSASLGAVGDDTESLLDSLHATAASLGGATGSLSQGLNEAEQALRSCAEGLRQAREPLDQARRDLDEAVSSGDFEAVRRIIGDRPAAVAQFLAAPTRLERIPVYPMADNGSAMSPFYTSLCLWIGAIFMVALMSVTVSPTQQRALAARMGRAPTEAELYLGRYGVFCLLGLGQALIVGLGNVFFLGVECEHFWLYLAACCLASVVFTNLVYTLTVSFGNIGKAIAIIGLVLQLAGSGGLMPVQMLSAPLFGAIYPWLPFAHSMPALEGAMAGIYGNHYLVNMGQLAAFLIPSLILGLVLRRPVIRLNNWVLAKLNETKFL